MQTMNRLLFTQMSFEDLEKLVVLNDSGIQKAPWDDLARGELTEVEQQIITYVTLGLRRFQPNLVNEATIWGRAIFPLLLLAEAEGFEAQANVPLFASLGDTELSGVADGAIGRPKAGEVRAPFLIVSEAKRGTEGANPVSQLYGEMLAAACLNAKEKGTHSARIFGSYTVADGWTFVRADISGLDTPRPVIAVVSSWELDEKSEAATIVKILKSIVALQAQIKA